MHDLRHTLTARLQGKSTLSTAPRGYREPGGTIALSFGQLAATITAGPFHHAPTNRDEAQKWFRVRLTDQLRAPSELDFIIPDFSTPTQADMRNAIVVMLSAALRGEQLYVGCYGGMGRTGLVLACLTKVAHAYDALMGLGKDVDPVEHVRSVYDSRAVETRGQMDFVEAFDPEPVLALFLKMERARYGQVLLPLLAEARIRVRAMVRVFAGRVRAASRAAVAAFRAV